ncbi:hypothetical protein NE237_030552 [Protea cynaroides]|uniref:heme oxygenase (biliverdin-producing) n=1 Tax=Protea cynaroides TaxID=273540 RepID=A0A9Q0JX33_9MAGN|nr:hypothetical protein NE237_030552 [Protea cynaroides]
MDSISWVLVLRFVYFPRSSFPLRRPCRLSFAYRHRPPSLLAEMGQTPANKRKQPDSKSTPRVSDFEQVLYDLIKSKQDMGIKKWEMTREANLPNDVVTKCLKSLIAKKLIREVENFRNKGKRHNIYMAAEFKPSTEVTGGSWYVNGNLDTEFIQALKDLCLKYVYRIKVATTEVITESIRRSGIINVECSTQKIAEMLQVLVLDNEIMEMQSSEIQDWKGQDSGTLAKDLEWFREQGYTILEPSSPGISYARYLEDLSEKDPQAFLCHFYNIYFAHTAGERMIGRKVAEKILDNKELEFYKWDGDLAHLLQGVTEKLNKVAEVGFFMPLLLILPLIYSTWIWL